MSQQSSQRSVFFDEWIKSLREQYKYVIRNNDQVTLPSLTAVMHNVGFSDDELAHLQVEATMHVDAVGADFVPDLNVLDPATAGQPHPAECLCPQCIPIDESLFDANGQPLSKTELEEANHDTGHVFPVAKIDTSQPTIVDDSVVEDMPIVNDDVTADDEILEPIVDDETLTFEDGLVEDTITEEELDNLEEDIADDPDAPQQMSMF